VYEFNDSMQIIARYYLAGEEAVEAATRAVANQATAMHG
jgi:hypothetical protein